MPLNDQEIIAKIKCGDYALRKPLKSSSAVWKTFDVVYDETNKPICAKCKKCNQIMSYGPSSGSSHLGRHTCLNKPNVSIQSMFGIQKPKVPISVKGDMADAAAIWCGKDLRPFDVVGGVGFKQYGQALINLGSKYGKVDIADVNPDPTTVSRHVHVNSEKLRTEVLPEVIEAISNNACAATSDMWDDKHTKTHYTTVTVHYIDKEWNLHKRVLFTSAFPDERKTGDNIKKQIINKLVSLGVDRKDANNIVWVTDRGSNMIKAFADFTRLSCMAHVNAKVLEHGWETVLNGKTLSCDVPEYDDIMTASKELVTYLKRTGLVKKLPKTVHQEVDTRWNSKIDMLTSIQSQYEDIEHLLEEKNPCDTHMQALDIKYMTDIIAILKPFQVATDALQADKYPTLYKVLLQYHKMQRSCKVQLHDDHRQKIYKARLHHFLEKLFYGELKMEHKVATFLHPTFHQLRMLSDKEKAEVHQVVKNQMEDITFVENGEKDDDESHPPPAKRQKKTSDDYSEWADISDDNPPNDEMQNYIEGSWKCSKDDELLEWWLQHTHEFPTLAVLAKRYHCIPASSASSERSFSAAGVLVSKRRTCLDKENVDDLLFIHDNY